MKNKHIDITLVALIFERIKERYIQVHTSRVKIPLRSFYESVKWFLGNFMCLLKGNISCQRSMHLLLFFTTFALSLNFE